ncbi:MAG: TFIIB-type zinc ribbon-containing protein [Bacilli bacterium]|nr:TFIIB-type zinc ribbon-containing protein [Bacilli bacterium]
MVKDVKVIDTDNKGKHGENRCPKCGASDVTYNTKKEKLICNYCYTEFEAEEVEGLVKEAKDLEGEARGSGTKDIKQSDDVITLRCGGCGAEVVINTNEATNARCHWCRSILSINSQIDNGAIPDVVLPFKLEKEEAKKKIQEFVDKRQSFANPTFRKEFTTNNIMGVYFPYLLVDANGHGTFKGKGEHLVREYTVKVKDDDEETRYDADYYEVERDFDVSIDDLSIESSADKLDRKNKSKTTNVINSIMPFDTENCVKYKANYLAGYSSEKRDINISNIENRVEKQLKDITRIELNKEIKFYDRGVKWEQEDLSLKGKQWISAYLPVWLYSYQDQKSVLHYVAVNARTGETMGSVPMNKKKLALISFGVDLLIFLLVFFLTRNTNATALYLLYIFLLFGPIYYASKISKYRNAAARHKYEKETKCTITNVKENDKLLKHKTDLSNSSMIDANNTRIEGESTKLDL